MENWRVTCIIVAMAVVAIAFAALYGNAIRETSSAPLKTVAATNVASSCPALSRLPKCLMCLMRADHRFYLAKNLSPTLKNENS